MMDMRTWKGDEQDDVEHECIQKSQLSPSEQEGFTRRLKGLCTPREACSTMGGAGTSTDSPNDFFFLSELRNYVLHVMGFVNWVWY